VNSKIIGTIELDDALLDSEVEKILGFGDVKEEYSEYRFGLWKNYVLWNGSGDVKDTLFKGPRGGAMKTEFGEQLDYINSIIEANFYTERIKMVRAILLQDAIVIPHRDYVEFKADSESLARVQIPIKTSLDCLHSEGRDVFHMRKGEIWFLDVNSTHSACNLSDSPRISLVLDFQLDGEPLNSLLKGEQRSRKPETGALMIEREPLDESFLQTIASMKHVINRMNFRDVVLFLSRVHFYRDVEQDMLFDWLIDICREQKDQSLLEKSLRFKTYMVKDRELKERFFL
jgi:hypothetical protein